MARDFFSRFAATDFVWTFLLHQVEHPLEDGAGTRPESPPAAEATSFMIRGAGDDVQRFEELLVYLQDQSLKSGVNRIILSAPVMRTISRSSSNSVAPVTGTSGN